MEYQYPRFTPEMKKTHTILMPNMAPIHFEMIVEAMRDEGYKVELLDNSGHDVAQEGLKYVHNDTCYPALLVIGQFINALKSGKYDLDRTALIITQTGGGCRASNYIHLLRKALVKAGFPQVPVASLNFSGLEKDSGFQLTLPLIRKVLAAVFYGDELMSLANQTRPYENQPGSADALVHRWVREIADPVSYTHLGVVLSALGWYDPLAEFAGAGATVPLLGFGHLLAQGVVDAVEQQGLLGALTGGFTAAAGGVTGSLTVGFLLSLVAKSRDQN